MRPLLATDLMLLAWSDTKGMLYSDHADKLDAAVAGALLLDSIDEGLVALEGKRLRPVGGRSGEALLDRPLEVAERRGRPPTVDAAVKALAGVGLLRDAEALLLQVGALASERRKLLGVIPMSSRRLVDRSRVQALREAVRDVLLADDVPGGTDDRILRLAALAGPPRLVDVLVPRGRRSSARRLATRIAAADQALSTVVAAVNEALTVQVMPPAGPPGSD